MNASDPGTTNHDKYTRGVKNPVVRRLMDGLFDQVRRTLREERPASLLDAGCGEGHALQWLAEDLPPVVAGFDQNPAAVAYCQQLHPTGDFRVADIYALDYDDRAFDIVLAMEVLEHLDHPEKALSELLRVANRGVILTVPWEPWFQLGNLARGQHLAGWGNHPEHVQHWGKRGFREFLQTTYSGRIDVGGAWPWLVAWIKGPFGPEAVRSAGGV